MITSPPQATFIVLHAACRAAVTTDILHKRRRNTIQQQPAGVTEGAFLTIVADAMVTLDSLLPAWVTFDWFTVDETTGLDGFYLDSYENMLRDAFDV